MKLTKKKKSLHKNAIAEGKRMRKALEDLLETYLKDVPEDLEAQKEVHDLFESLKKI